jgi:hypothetical protein
MGTASMAKAVKGIIFAWRTYWWVKTAVYAALLLAAIFGVGPWGSSPPMRWLTDAEIWMRVHTAHPVALGFLVGLMFSTWLIPDAWRWLKKNFGDKSRAELVVDGPHIFRDFVYRSNCRYRMKIHNRGPATANNVQMKLRNMPKAPWSARWRGDYSYPVLRPGLTLDSPECRINRNDDQEFEVLFGWQAEDGRFYVNLDTKNGTYNPIDMHPDERWELEYEITAENADPIKCSIEAYIENGAIAAKRKG